VLLLSITDLRLCTKGSQRNLLFMAYRSQENLAVNGAPATEALKGITLLRSIVTTAFAVAALSAVSVAAELPEAPSSSAMRMNAAMITTTVPVSAPRIAETSTVDKKFLSLAFISTSSTFADSYTTLFARDNWLAHKQGVCNEEVESAYLYGTHPTVARAYAVATVKSAGAIVAAYYLRKHHSRLWSLPLFANSAISLQGVTQNMIACN
jgi:hypothetical protein